MAKIKVKSKVNIAEKTSDDKSAGTSSQAVVSKDESTGQTTSYYSKTKENGDNQKFKAFTKTESEGESPRYEMKKAYKPLFSSKYKEVDKPISASRGERKIEEMKKFLNNK
jgi:hypothetical protein